MNQRVLLMACVVGYCVPCLLAQTDSAPKFQKVGAPVTVAELMQRTLQGQLGLPLGTVTEVDAEIVSGRALGRKALQSAYLLKITHVRGQKLAQDLVVEFHIPAFASVKLANGQFALYELITGAKTGSLSSDQIQDLEKGYVGKSVRLVVYETGSFSGIPSGLPDDVPVWAGTNFQFSTSLVVLAEREK